jgi:integrase
MYAVSLIQPTMSEGNKLKTWYMQWKDPATGKKKRKSTHTRDKALARVIAQQMHERIIRQVHGLPELISEKQGQPIGPQLDAYEKALRAKRRNGDYIDQTLQRARRLVDECDWKTLADINFEAAELALGRLTDARSKKLLSNAARNGYMTSIKAFAGWEVKTKRLEKNPLICLEKLNPELTRKRVRRALSPSALARLVKAAVAGPVVERIGPRERGLAYLVSAYTGYRRRALAALRVADFDLENAQVVLPATAAKNGKVTPPTPLHPDLIPMLRKAFVGLGPEDRPFGKLTKHASADGFKIDMAAAKLPLRDDQGRVADLHALRGTFSTMLQQSGTSRLETSRLMHHAHPNQTDNYTTTTTEEARAAINRLPPPPTLD